ncbi:MAG: class I SAM-dependent methyltransferase [Flavobacteriales bacterium]|nr:class I SAM-dependent methyltransferase [Flavobacteriales bacterium]
MTSFDAAAKFYDEEFTRSTIGRMQRKRVWTYLEKTMGDKPLRILEINGGTGEDAIWLAQQGHDVTCTDISPEMLAIAEQKAVHLSDDLGIHFKKLDVRKIHEFEMEDEFDVVFSNFGGLNCISPEDLKLFCSALPWLLAPSGRFIGVFLGKFCFWEYLYFTMKGDRKKAWRRQSKEAVMANVSGVQIPTWYYHADEIRELNPKSELMGLKSVGSFIPPSYLQPFFDNKKGLLRALRNLEYATDGINFLSSLADHFLVDLKFAAVKN